MPKKTFFIFLSSCIFIFLSVAAPAFALPALLPSCISDGNCTLNDMTQVFGNLARIILGVTGSFALLMFIYGGFVWLTAAGAPDKVENGRKILVGAVIGIVIIFGAYIGVQFFMDAIGTGDIAKTGSSCGDNKVWTSGEGDKLECRTECEVE
ncbi:MAG: pilin, partial [Patescibacteria group bacterium]|nr:pilin [Patescibacteria group bacterium]